MKDDPKKLIDLPRSQWKAIYRSPKAPLLRAQVPGAIAYVVAFLIVFAVSAYLRDKWTQPAPRSLPPGEYTWTPEKGVQPVPKP